MCLSRNLGGGIYAVFTIWEIQNYYVEFGVSKSWFLLLKGCQVYRKLFVCLFVLNKQTKNLEVIRHNSFSTSAQPVCFPMEQINAVSN